MHTGARLYKILLLENKATCEVMNLIKLAQRCLEFNLNTTCPVRTSSGSTTNPQVNQLKQDGGGCLVKIEYYSNKLNLLVCIRSNTQ